MPRLVSTEVAVASRSAGRVKLGQPLPESYLSFDEKSSAPQQTQRYSPFLRLV